MDERRPLRQQFASDNYSGICPEAMAALQEANTGHAASYGDDPWTREACDLFRELFAADCEVFFALNGTAGNALSMAALCQSYHGIICHRLAHVETDECGAPEFFAHGAKILTADGENGKLTPAGIQQLVTRRTDIHYPKPRVVSLTQATEVGTVYTPDELQAIRRTADAHGLRIQMDGARFANAVAHLDCAPRALTRDVGVDVLCLGGSKNGLALGEAVLFFDRAVAHEFDYRCKQAGQLAAKMRFVAAQWLGVLRTGAWLRHAQHANHCAALLAQALHDLPEVEPMFPRGANSLFLRMGDPVIAALQRAGWHFYTFIGAGGVRLMCSWDTSEATVHAFVDDLKAALVAHRG